MLCRFLFETSQSRSNWSRSACSNNHVNYNCDGVDIDGCRDVTISDCNIDTDDDALCLKSTLPRPTENVTITNCILRSHCTALKLGTESNGGFRNIAVSNCTILSPRGTKPFWGYPEGRCGIALETVNGGRLENVTISNIVIDGVAIPLFMRLGNRARPHTADAPRPGVGTFRNVTLSSITATGAGKIGCAIAGLPGHRIENVTLRDLRCEFAGGGTTEEANRRIPGLRAVYCATTQDPLSQHGKSQDFSDALPCWTSSGSDDSRSDTQGIAAAGTRVAQFLTLQFSWLDDLLGC